MPLTPNSSFIRKSDPDGFEIKQRRLRDALKSGAHPATAAHYAGITPATLARWIKEGQALSALWEKVAVDPDDEREPSVSELELISIYESVVQEQAESELNLVEVIKRAADDLDDWRAAAWLLERRHKERWSPRAEVTGADGGALQIEDPNDRRQTVMEALDKIEQRLREADAMTEGGAEVVSIRRELDPGGIEDADEVDEDDAV